MNGDRFRQDAHVDEPGMVGARWWQDSVADPIGRRSVIVGLITTGAVLGLSVLAFEDGNPTRPARVGTLDIQRKYGWSFGAATETLVFNGRSTEPFDPSRLDRMVSELAPRVAAHRPFYVATLFESPTALPAAVATGDPAIITALKSALRPLFTDGMREAYDIARAAGEALANQGCALVVDLDGQDSVAFAAGAIAWFDPIFLFDNWPHPRGVVPAHLTLAAAAYYQPLFAEARQAPAPAGARPSLAPMFVLDRQRLANYSDDANQFDNRWVARMPGVQALRAMGIDRLLYIAPAAAAHELDDLNDDFVTDHTAGIAIALVPIDVLEEKLPRFDFVPVPRRTPFSSGIAGGGRPTPAGFGSVPVVVSMLGGTLLGVAWSRSGTWNRGGGG